MNLHLAGALPRGLPAAVICSPRAGHAVPEVPRSRRPAADGIVKFQTPEIVFGPGALAEAGFAARRIGAQRPFVVTDPGIIEAGWVAELSRYLADVGLAATVWPGITPNPKEKKVAAGYDCYQDLGCDVIIAIGGGSVIDAAKGIAILCGNGGEILDYTGVDRVRMPGLRPAGGTVRASATPGSPARRWQARRRDGSSSSTCWTPINAAGPGRRPPSRGARWSVPAPPTTRARSTPTPTPGGAGTTTRPHLIPDGSPRTQDAQAPAVRPATRQRRDSRPGERRPRCQAGNRAITRPPSSRGAASPRHDDDRRRANQLRTGRWCPMAAMRPGRDSRWDVASNHCGAAGRAPAPGGGPEGGRR